MPNAAQDAGPAQAAPITVLVIDDDAEMRAVLRDVLVREGFQVREQAGRDGVIAALDSLPPDVIVLDKEMPGGNGLELLAYIRRRHPSLPVVFITAFGGPAVRAEALRRGAARYVEKPFRVAHLLDTLRSLTGRHAAVGTSEV